jgi:beta-galactosidase
MLDQLRWLYSPLYRRSVTADFCQPGEELAGYQALLVPSLYLVTAAEAANIRAAVERGATAVISFWSGISDERDQVYLGPYGGPLRPLIGCDVLEVAPLAPGDVVELEWADGGRTTASFWLDIATDLGASDATVLARVATGPWAGRPAVVQRAYGQGTAYYLGARLDEAGLARVYDRVPGLLAQAGRSPAAEAPGVERVTRATPDGRRYEFLVNQTDTGREVWLDEPGFELIGGHTVDGAITLGPRGVAIVQRG